MNWSIEKITIDFANCGTPTSQSADVAIMLSQPWTYQSETQGCFHFTIKEVRIKNAYWGYWAHSWHFMGTLKDIWVTSSRNGFFQGGGTTMIFDHCWTKGNKDPTKDGKVFYLGANGACYNFILNNCAAEDYYVKNDRLFYMQYCRGLVINGLHAEYNKIIADGTGASLLFFGDSDGLQFNGLHTIGNTLQVDNNNSGSYLIEFGSAYGIFSGISVGGKGSTKERPVPDDYYVAASKTGTAISTLVITGTSHVVVAGGVCYPPKKKSGSADPSNPASSIQSISQGANVVQIALDLDGGTEIDHYDTMCTLSGKSGVTGD